VLEEGLVRGEMGLTTGDKGKVSSVIGGLTTGDKGKISSVIGGLDKTA
jgi:hypothetical protein